MHASLTHAVPWIPQNQIPIMSCTKFKLNHTCKRSSESTGSQDRGKVGGRVFDGLEDLLVTCTVDKELPINLFKVAVCLLVWALMLPVVLASRLGLIDGLAGFAHVGSLDFVEERLEKKVTLTKHFIV